jgi:putative transposase
MSIRKVNFVQGEYYHIYNRGNSKQKIFNDEKDYKHFIQLLYLSNTIRKVILRDISKDVFNFDQEKEIVSIGAYCLMPNHFHILITQTENGSISKFMQKLSTAYSMYYNKKYKRTGSLFEGKFKSEHINNNKYFKYLFSYIHLNPVKLIQKDWKEKGINNKKEVLEFLDQYKYSSYLDFLEEKRIQNKIINTEIFLKYFINKNSFIKEIFEWLNYNK